MTFFRARSPQEDVLSRCLAAVVEGPGSRGRVFLAFRGLLLRGVSCFRGALCRGFGLRSSCFGGPCICDLGRQASRLIWQRFRGLRQHNSPRDPTSPNLNARKDLGPGSAAELRPSRSKPKRARAQHLILLLAIIHVGLLLDDLGL